MKFKTITILLVIIVAGIWGYTLIQKMQQKTVTVHETPIVEKNVGVSLEKKIEQLKQNLLDDLKGKEIQGYENNSLVIVFDPAEKDLAQCRKTGGVKLRCYSIGDFNFKIGTVQGYYSKLYSEELNDKQAMEIAMDSKLSRELAYDIIFDEEPGGIYNWSNSAKKIDAASRITFIRELEK